MHTAHQMPLSYLISAPRCYPQDNLLPRYSAGYDCHYIQGGSSSTDTLPPESRGQKYRPGALRSDPTKAAPLFWASLSQFPQHPFTSREFTKCRSCGSGAESSKNKKIFKNCIRCWTLEMNSQERLHSSHPCEDFRGQGESGLSPKLGFSRKSPFWTNKDNVPIYLEVEVWGSRWTSSWWPFGSAWLRLSRPSGAKAVWPTQMTST